MIADLSVSLEVARFLASGPAPERIITFHPTPEASARVAALLAASREGTLSEDERAELESSIALERMMRLVKAEARRLLAQRAP
jgi:hypothetical protein